MIQLFPAAVALFANAEQKPRGTLKYSFVTEVLIEHRLLLTLYQKLLMNFSYILKANIYI